MCYNTFAIHPVKAVGTAAGYFKEHLIDVLIRTVIEPYKR